MNLTFLTQSKTLWFLLAVTLIVTVSFGVVMQVWDFELIDEMLNADQITNHIAAFTDEQKQAHIWVTATLDVIYPFAYGFLFAGVALKAFENHGAWLAAICLVCIPVDLTEGFSQVMLLLGDANYMGLKTTVTPIKFALFFFGLVVSILGALKLYRASKKI